MTEARVGAVAQGSLAALAWAEPDCLGPGVSAVRPELSRPIAPPDQRKREASDTSTPTSKYAMAT